MSKTITDGHIVIAGLDWTGLDWTGLDWTGLRLDLAWTGPRLKAFFHVSSS